MAKAVDNITGAKSIVSGYVKDARSGEVLIGATIQIRDLKVVGVSNNYGFYSLSVPSGIYTIECSYVGYTNKSQSLSINSNIRIDFELEESITHLGEVVIKSDKLEDKIRRPEMSMNKMEMKTIKKIPALLGEIDVVKAIQMLPGVLPTSEGSSGFSVRGGSADQNLILLDEATVYNASHLMGFFSVFNNDAVKDVKLYKGDIPAAYGGRLSSLLDVRMKEGNMKKFNATGGIGLISSRLTLEGPLVKDKCSFVLSGRRTYVDIFFPLLSNFTQDNIKDATLYFYDLNAKINYTIGQNDRVFFSAYGGQDNFGNGTNLFSYGNSSYTLRWNHQYSPSLFNNVSLIRSMYHYKMGTGSGNINSYLWTSGMEDYTLKLDFSWYVNPSNTIKFGVMGTYHSFYPGIIERTSSDSTYQPFKIDNHYNLEYGVYISNEQNISDKLTVKYGLRFSLFQNIGKDYIYNIDQNYNVKDSIAYGNGEIFNTYYNPEPRLGLNYQLNDVSAVKASCSRSAQYVQLASNSTAGTPLDIWFPASPNVKPQISDLYALGYVRNLRKNTLEASVEIYYKKLENVIDFKDNASLLFNNKLEGELRFGKGYAYGFEVMLQLNTERLNGWISYTYSKSMRTVKGINENYPEKISKYVSPFDKPHSVNVVLNREIFPRYTLSANWVFTTGAPLTLPGFKWVYQKVILPGYIERNSYRMPDYHRLDLSLSIKSKNKPFGLWDGEWVFSIYNAYNRHNMWTINFEPDPNNPDRKKAVKLYLFSVIPAITYNFNF